MNSPRRSRRSSRPAGPPRPPSRMSPITSRPPLPLPSCGSGSAPPAVRAPTPADPAAAVAELRERLGPAGVLINNAGVAGPAGPMWDADPAEWWRTLEVNLGGAYTLTRIVLPDMIAAGQGRILNITSHAGVYRWRMQAAYAISKAALVKLTENLAAETRRYGVPVLSVDPGLLPIGFSQARRNSAPDPGTAEARIAD